MKWEYEEYYFDMPFDLVVDLSESYLKTLTRNNRCERKISIFVFSTMPTNGLAQLGVPAIEVCKAEPRKYAVAAHYMLTFAVFVN